MRQRIALLHTRNRHAHGIRGLVARGAGAAVRSQWLKEGIQGGNRYAISIECLPKAGCVRVLFER